MRANALCIPLADESVDLIVTSPPYFTLRSYRDDEGEHYPGQLGSEETPRAFLEALWAVTAECWRVLRPSGSLWVNLGDKYSQRVATRVSSHQDGLFPGRPELKKDWKRDRAAGLARMPNENIMPSGVAPREKSLMGLPWRYVIGCIDGAAAPNDQQWILRAEVVWDKPNGMPESVGDRVRRSHEQVFHLTKEGRYYTAVDEVREEYAPGTAERYAAGYNDRAIDDERPSVNTKLGGDTYGENPLGKLPGSVWNIPSEPLVIPESAARRYNLPSHFAAFPLELPRRIILGWSPPSICLACGEGRRPVSSVEREHGWTRATDGTRGGDRHAGEDVGQEVTNRALRTIYGYACACTPRTSHRGEGDWKQGREEMPEHGSDDWHSPGNAVPRRPGGFGTKVPRSAGEWEYHLEGWEAPPTRTAVVLDPFGGTGTTAMVARALGRFGISMDLSEGYNRLARWRIFESKQGAKAVNRTNREAQGVML